MPHKVEVAPTGRASCRGCKKTIAKGELRFGEEFANQFSEDGGMSYRYWHLACAATKLANELAPALAAYEGDVPDRAAIDAAVAEHLRPEMPYAEQAPNGRARCRACDQTIAKGGLRVAFERTFDGPMGPQKGAAYVHAACLPKHLERERENGQEVPEAGAMLDQIEAHSPRISAADRAALRAAFPAEA
jgi:Poly(ADP-ribose) polymerase and DNA-Ligase Zn-finger region